MEFVALSDKEFNILAREDPLLRISFRGVFPADKLHSVPKGRQFTDAYTRIQLVNWVNIG